MWEDIWWEICNLSWVQWFVIVLVFFFGVLMVAVISRDINNPCVEYSEKITTTYVLVGNVMMPIESRNCLRREE